MCDFKMTTTESIKSEIKKILEADKFLFDTRKLNNFEQKKDIEYSDEKYSDLVISIFTSEYKKNVLGSTGSLEILTKSSNLIKNISYKIFEDKTFNYCNKITNFIKKYEKCIKSDITKFQNLLVSNEIAISNETIINLSKEVSIFEAPMARMIRIWKILTSKYIIKHHENLAKNYIENSDTSNFNKEFFQNIQKHLPFEEVNFTATMNQRYVYYYVDKKKHMIEFVKYLMKLGGDYNGLKNVYDSAFYIDDFLLKNEAPSIVATVKRKRKDSKEEQKYNNNEDTTVLLNLISELKEEINKKNNSEENDTKKVINMLEKIINKGIKIDEESSEEFYQNNKKLLLETLDESRKDISQTDTTQGSSSMMQINETCDGHDNSCNLSLQPESSEGSKDESEAAKHLMKIYQNEVFADVHINCLEQKLKANKCILASFSQVFAEKLKTSDFIDMSLLPYKVVKGMLDYIYTNKIEKLEEICIDLMILAHDYQIGGLKDLCEAAILTNLNINNASHALIAAFKCDSLDLKKKIMTFIFVNRSVINSIESFQYLTKQYPQLICEILCNN